MKANYEEDKVIVSATEPTGVNRKKVWFKKGKNLFNKNNVISNVNLLANGSIESDTSCSIHYTEVVGGQIYTISSNSDRQWVFNTSAEKLSSSTQGAQRTVTSGTSVQVNVPSGHKYINIRHYPSNGEDNINQDIQLEQNPVVTAYEAYVEPEIYILNNNNVYERFYSKSELNKEHYSTGEQKIGTWIDGKTLYRKTIFKTVKITANTNLVINSEIQNIDTITKIDGVISSSTKTNYRQINTYNLENNAVSISMSASTNGNITIYSTDDWTTPNIIITLEYTKTTD